MIDRGDPKPVDVIAGVIGGLFFISRLQLSLLEGEDLARLATRLRPLVGRGWLVAAAAVS